MTVFTKRPIVDFWQGSKYASEFEYARVTHGSEYTGIFVKMPKSAWMAFVLHFPVVISCLKEPETVFLRRQNSIFFGNVWLFCFRLNIKSEISNWLLPSGFVNVDIPNKYIYNAFLNDLFIHISCCCCCFYTFWCFKGLNQRFAKTVFL